MRNILIEVEYDGTRFAGWQAQKGHKPQAPGSKLKTIQEEIEKTLQQILQEKIILIGSGRTDAGVHAKGQVANFKTNSKLPLKNIQRALNTYLPDTIVISNMQEVPLGFHSRFSAKSKIYRYTVLNREYSDAFLHRYVWKYPYRLDINLMKRQAKVLLGRHNFKSFQAQDKKGRSAVRTIKKLLITKNNDFLHFDIEADGFLYKMVRNIVGTLVMIGNGKKIDIKKILDSHDRKLSGQTAPAKGLCLLKVNYE